MFKDNFELLPGTGFQALVTAAPAAYAGFEAIRSGIKYGEKVEQIESLLNNRQSIDNPYKDIENPYKNLPVATQAARMQAEQADISLANTLDTLRATGAAAGGATALAQAALKSKQGVAASIEKQEATNARLQAKGQFETDMAKAKGESFRMRMQEARDVRDVNRMQGDADILRATQIANKRAMFNQLGQAGQALVGGVVPTKKEGGSSSGDGSGADLDAAGFVQNRFGGTDPVSDTVTSNMSLGVDTSIDATIPGVKQYSTVQGILANAEDPINLGSNIDMLNQQPQVQLQPITAPQQASNQTFVPKYKRPTLDMYADPEADTLYGQLGLSSLVKERNLLQSLGMTTQYIQPLINQQSKLLNQ